MKDNYSEMNVDMEEILLKKNYDDLTASELDEIKDFVSSKEEFNIMKNTLMNVKTSFNVEEEIEPVDSAKENLMKMFEQKHGKVVPMNKPRPFYLNPVFQIGVAALFILGIIYFYPKGENESMTAMNENKEEVKMEDESKSPEAASTEEISAESPVEEIEEANETEKVAELKKEELLEEKSIDAGYKFKASDDTKPFEKADVSKDVTSKTAVDVLAKGEGITSSYDKELSNLQTDANRSSKKEKAKEANSDNVVLADDKITSTNATTTLTFSSVTNGGVAVADELAVSGKADSKDADKKDGKTMRTNTAGGLYMQPGKPAADLKEGVSLKDEPALAEFLFTAL